MDWTTRAVLVTGGGGFIGSHLVEYLAARGARVRAFVRYVSNGTSGWLDRSAMRSEIEIVAGDIGDADCVRRAIKGIDVVFHLAALIGIPYSYHAPRSYVRTNVEGTLNVLNGAIDLGVQRLVHTSTSEVYGSARYVPMDESHPLLAQSPYSASKIAADKLAESFHRSFGLPVVTVRPFNTFGPRQSTRAVIPTIITQAQRGQPVRLGALHPVRDFTYVEDTVRGFVAAAETDAAVGQVVNLGTGVDVSVDALARKILAIMKVMLPIEAEAERVRSALSEVDRLQADNRLAARLLSWSPALSLEQGLSRTIEWFTGPTDPPSHRGASYHV